MPANIQFQKDDNFTTVYYQYAVDLSAVERFAQVLQEYSLAKITRIALTEIRDITWGNEQSGDFGNVRLSARLRFYCPADGKLCGCQIAAPAASMFNDDNSVKQSVGERLATEYSQLTGKTVEYRDGWLIGDTSPAPQV